MADDQTIYTMPAPDGKTYSIRGPKGASDDQIREQIIAQHPHLADPELAGFTPEKTTGQIYTEAAKHLPGSIASNVEETAGALWTIISNPKAAGKALYDMGWSGVGSAIKDDLAKHYGSMDRVQKTFEQDPARFAMDAISFGTAGSQLVRKLVVSVAKTARAAIPEVAGRLTDVAPEAFQAAGEAGEFGGPAAQQFRAGTRLPPQVPAQRIPYFQEAGEAVARGGWMPPLTRFRDVALGGAGLEAMAPTGAAAATAAGTLASSSPRLMGETMYGLGRAQRSMGDPSLLVAGGALSRPLSRATIRDLAKQTLKDPDTKKQLDNEQVKTLRRATRENATSDAMLAAQRVLTPLGMETLRPRSPQERINVGHMAFPSQYGGTDAGTTTNGTRATVRTPSPGQPSVPRAGSSPAPSPAQPPAAPAAAPTRIAGDVVPGPTGGATERPSLEDRMAAERLRTMQGIFPGRFQTPTAPNVLPIKTGKLQELWDKILKGKRFTELS